MRGGGGALTSHVDLSEPRYPEKAFCPQGHCMGLQMGAKADTACRRHSRSHFITHTSHYVRLFIIVVLFYICHWDWCVVWNMSAPCWGPEHLKVAVS